MHGGSRRAALGTLGLTALVVTAWIASPRAERTTQGFHNDGRALEQAMVDVLRALFREDTPAARRALDRMEGLCRRLGPDDLDTLGSGLVQLDRAVHKTLDGTRESAGQGEVDAAFDEFVWVQRSCRQCHAAAREQGRLPSKGPLW